jgi:hypothetical protein
LREVQRGEAIENAPTVRALRPGVAQSENAPAGGAKSRIALFMGIAILSIGLAIIALNWSPPDHSEQSESPVLSSTELAQRAQDLGSLALADAVLASPTTAPIDPRDAQISELLARAEAQRSSGKILSPPGDNALASLREVLSLDANSSAARKAIAALHNEQSKASDRAMRAGDLGAAQLAMDYARPSTRAARHLRYRALPCATHDINSHNRRASRRSLTTNAKLPPQRKPRLRRNNKRYCVQSATRKLVQSAIRKLTQSMRRKFAHKQRDWNNRRESNSARRPRCRQKNAIKQLRAHARNKGSAKANGWLLSSARRHLVLRRARHR